MTAPASFRALLKHYRLAAGLSQEALAERATLSVRAISDLERGVKRRPYPRTVALLAEALRLAAADRAILIAAAHGLADGSIDTATAPDPPSYASTFPASAAAPNDLPRPGTPLIGRGWEEVELARLVRQERRHLLTLTGPGGIGKTRLALQVAANLHDLGVDGVYFVPLATLLDPALVLVTIAQVLGVREAPGQSLLEHVIAQLGEKSIVLVLDNLEHLLQAAGLVAALVARRPRLIVLATSRAPLHVEGEQEFPVPGLAWPDPGGRTPLEEMHLYPAVDLFVQRVRSFKPDFRISADTAAAVAGICARLDGVPLAIELAAARVRILPPQTLLARLTGAYDYPLLRVLAGGVQHLPIRHQTMRNAIAWSYNLLDSDEQSLFQQLAVFVGGCTLGAAEAVCQVTGGLDLLDGLTNLVDHNLLRSEERLQGEARFEMLGTIREFGLECLSASNNAEAIRHRHGLYFAALAESAEAEFYGVQEVVWLARLDIEHDNLREAARCAREAGEATLGLRLAGALCPFWRKRGNLAEGRRWLDDILSISEQGPAPLRAKACAGAGMLALHQADYSRATALLAEGQTIFRSIGDTAGIASVLNNLGRLAESQGEYQRAGPLYEESLAMFRQLGDRMGIGNELNNLGNVAHHCGNYQQARGFLEESLTLFRELGSRDGMGVALSNLGNLAHDRGDFTMARAWYEQSLVLHRDAGDAWAIAIMLNNLGSVAVFQQEFLRAKALHEESLALRKEIGDKRGIAVSLHNLGTVADAQGEHDRAATLYRESLALLWSVNHREGIAGCLESLVGVEYARGQQEAAARIAGAAMTLRAAIGAPMAPADRGPYDQTLRTLRAVLGEAAFTAAWEVGQTLSLDEAVAYGLVPSP